MLTYFLYNRFFSVETFLRPRRQLTAGRSAKLPGDLLAVGFRGVLGNPFGSFVAHYLGPFCALLFSGITLGNVFAFLFLYGLTLHNVVLDVVRMIAGLARGFVYSFALYGALALTDQGCVTEFNTLFTCHFLVLNEAILDIVLLAYLLLLGLEIRRVGGVASFGVAVFASHNVVVFGFFDHNHLVTPQGVSSIFRKIKSF